MRHEAERRCTQAAYLFAACAGGGILGLNVTPESTRRTTVEDVFAPHMQTRGELVRGGGGRVAWGVQQAKYLAHYFDFIARPTGRATMTTCGRCTSAASLP